MYLSKTDRTKQYLCSFVLATGCVIWFANTTLGIYKMFPTIILILLCSKYLITTKCKQARYVTVLAAVTIISATITQPSSQSFNYMFLWSLLENVIFLIIGYNFAKNNLITNKFIFCIIFIIGAISSLTITNFLFGFPNWTSPIEGNRLETLFIEHNITNIEAGKLYSTGFGIGRTGWAATLSLFIPLCLLCIENKYKTKLSKLLLCIIFTSIFISGSRGGLVSVATMLLLYVVFVYKNKQKSVSTLFIASTIILMLCILYSSFLIEHLRLDSSDLTTGRSEQYELIPKMFETMGFWGLGENGTSTFLSRYGIDHELHNSYINNFLKYGWIVGISIIIGSFYLIKIAFLSLKNGRNIYLKVFPLIIISGFISALFEPQAIYGARSWYVVWWFFLGALLFYINNKGYSSSKRIEQ